MGPRRYNIRSDADARAVRRPGLRRGRALARRRPRRLVGAPPSRRETSGAGPRPGPGGRRAGGAAGGVLPGRGGRLRGRRARARRGLLRRLPARPARRPARRGRDLRGAGRARRPARRGARRGHVLRAQPARALRAVPPCRRHGRDRLLRLARGRLQAPPARARGRAPLTRAPAVSLAEDLRDELAAIAPRRRCCRLAELSALFHAAGVWHLRGRGELAVHLDVGSGHAARRAFTLLRELGVPAEIRTYRRRAFDRATRYQLHAAVDAHAREVLREAGVLSERGAPLERPPKRVVGRSCCRGAYLRGALLGAGSLSGPRAPHLELRAAGPAAARTPSRTRRAARRSPTCSPSPARARPRSGSTSTPSSPRRARTRTGSGTRTRRT